MESNCKLISIITVTYNCQETIEETIQSVIGFKSEEVEYIVIDGSSTDDTIKLIQNYIDNIDVFISEPDKGVYEAMNKGIQHAKGKYIYHLNAGDRLNYLPIEELKLLNKYSPSIVSFPVKLDNDEVFKPSIGFKIRITNTLHHQGSFYFKDDITYDTAYQVFSDFDLNQKLFSRNKKIIVHTNLIHYVAYHNMDGISHNKENTKEFFKIIYNNYGIVSCIISYIYLKLKGRYQWLRQRFNSIFL